MSKVREWPGRVVFAVWALLALSAMIFRHQLGEIIGARIGSALLGGFAFIMGLIFF